MHLQIDLTPVVVRYIRKHGIAYWNDLYRHIEAELPLDEEDYVTLVDGSIRYQSNLRNLKSNRSLVKYHNDIIQISGGFATIQFAKDNNIPEQTVTDCPPRTPRTRQPRIVKPTGKGEKANRTAWKHCFADLKELYDRDIVLADVKEMGAVAFGEKYNLTPRIV